MVRILLFCIVTVGLLRQSRLSDIDMQLWESDSNITFSIDSAFQTPTDEDYVRQSFRSSDSLKVISYQGLIGGLPTPINKTIYAELANSLWQINMVDQSERLYLNILSAEYYALRNHPSGTRYGYGSYTSDERNTAATRLGMIYLHKHEFEKAKQYLDLAVKKYPVSYSCGTGFLSQQGRYEALYRLCDKGQVQSSSNVEK